jgi:uncharacterized membrane protein
LQPTPSRHLSDYTNRPLEILIAILSVAPIFILIYCYSILPDRVPIFLNLHGEVEVWAAKSIASVFRLPAMAIDLQVLCLLMKYGVVRSKPITITGFAEESRQYQTRSIALYAALWDWLRCLIAFKMGAESLDILFLQDQGRHLFRTVTWALPRAAAFLAVVVACLYLYRLMAIRRELKTAVGSIVIENHLEPEYVHARIFYYNAADPALFAGKYLFNFGNKLVYVLIGVLVAYPLLVFLSF